MRERNQLKMSLQLTCESFDRTEVYPQKNACPDVFSRLRWRLLSKKAGFPPPAFWVSITTELIDNN